MRRIAWLSDIHLNFLTLAAVDRFLAEVVAARPDAVLIGGDIAEAYDVCEYLDRLHEAIAVPIYFVLGNHDFYRGSIPRVRQKVVDFCRQRERLTYLTAADVISLTPHVGLIGHDDWADGRTGDYLRSLVGMQDYRLIEELSGLGKIERWKTLHALGDEAAAHIRRVLPLALAQYREVICLTHVPPLREACWHSGAISDDSWSPHFTCVAMGDALLECMREQPDRRLTVLCGHTHGAGYTQPLPNMEVFTAGAEYGQPGIQRVWELE